MGGEHSRDQSGGTLTGAYAPSLVNVSPELLPGKVTKTFRYTVPSPNAPNRNGRKVWVTVNGERIAAMIPDGVKTGEKFEFQHETVELDKVFASTLHSIPGHEIVQAKPIVWGSISNSFTACNQRSMGTKVGELMQQAQVEVLKQTIEAGCNSVLGMSFNITNDSSGDRGYNKIVIVTVTGTPCVVMPLVQKPAVVADVIVEPLTNS